MLSIVPSQTITGQENAGSEPSYQLTFTVTFPTNDFSFSNLQGFDTIQLNDGGYTMGLGKPMLPTKTIQVALPTGMKVSSVSIVKVKENTLNGSYTVYPTQSPLPSNEDNNQSQFIQPDAQTYSSDQPYPAALIEFVGQSDLAGQDLANFILYPLHYIPDQKQLILVSSITFTIQCTGGYIYGDYLPAGISQNERATYQTMIQGMVINPEDVVLQTSPDPQQMGVDPGDYEYVIITQASWVTAFQPLADWKTQKGVPATIVTTDWIYNNGGYSGTNVQKIRAFIQDAYNTWGTIYVLLGGDTDVVPCSYQTFPSVDSDPVPNDAYYADFDGDWVCEVNVGRASVTGPGNGYGQIGNFISKVLTYETNPPLTDYATHAGFFGFDLDSSTHAEQCKITIDNTYLPSDWTVTTVYDSQGGNHQTNAINALNAGQNLVNHADHSSPDYMGTGYINHDWGIDSSDMDALTNGNKQSILYSMGCDPAAYDDPSSIAEHFVRNNNGGGIAFIGNSRYGWYNSGQYNTLSMAYDVHFFKSLFQENFYNLGAAFSDHKNDVMNSHSGNSYYQYCFTEITLLGDPELPIWTENPASLSATYPNQVPVGSSSFTVTVTSNGSPVDQAYICLWKGTDVYLTGFTDNTGTFTFTLSPTTPGAMSVTVTKQNFIPSQGSTMVVSDDNNPPATPMTPTGTSTGLINVPYTYATTTTDPDNDQIWYQWKFGTDVTDWLGPYTSGAQAQATYTWATPGTYEVKVKAKDSFGYESSWSSSLSVSITDQKPSLSLGVITGRLFTISTSILNGGPAVATHVTWQITVDGGLMLSGQTMTGSEDILNPNGTVAIEDSPIIGIGPVTITVTVNADGVAEITKTVNAFVLVVFVIMT